MDVNMWTFVDTTLGIGHTIYSTILLKEIHSTFLLFGYQNGVEVIYVD